MSTETIRLIRDGEKGGKGVRRWGEREREIIYLSLHCHHQNDSCIKMGSDESHFNISVGSDGQSDKTLSTNHNLFDEKGEPKRYRTEVLLLTNLTPYRQAKPALNYRVIKRGLIHTRPSLASANKSDLPSRRRVLFLIQGVVFPERTVQGRQSIQLGESAFL